MLASIACLFLAAAPHTGNDPIAGPTASPWMAQEPAEPPAVQRGDEAPQAAPAAQTDGEERVRAAGRPSIGWFALLGGTVHTLVPGAEPAIATLVVGDGTIQAIGPEVEPPPGCELIDISGAHVVPGLVDNAAYHDPRHDPLYTRFGITAIRDHGNDLGLILGQHDLAVRDARGGPRLVIAGAPFDGNPPTTNEALVPSSAAEASAQVRELHEVGADFVSLQPGLGARERRAVVATAHDLGLGAWGVAPERDGETGDGNSGADPNAEPARSPVARMVAEGVDGILYLDGFLPPGTTWLDHEPADMAALAEPFRGVALAVTPLLGTVARRLDDRGPDSPWFEALSPHYESLWRADWQAHEAGWSAELAARGQAVLANQRALVLALHEAGVVLLPGSGAPHPWLVPGLSLHEELAEWRRAGLPVEAILAAATRESARAAGPALGDGTLQRGQTADLVVVERDPRDDLEALAAPRAVVLRGRLFEARDLEDLYRSVVNEAGLERERAEEPLAIQPPEKPDGELVSEGYAEVQSAAGRLSAERWVVVRAPNGRLVFRSRGLTTEGTDVFLEQTLAQGNLEGFRFALSGGDLHYEAQAERVGGRLRMRRRVNGETIDTRYVPIPVAAIDVGSVTTLMLLAHQQGLGDFDVLRLHQGAEMELARWKLELDEEDQHLFLTPQGPRLVSFDTDGVPRAVVRRQGNAWTKVVIGEFAVGQPLGLAVGGRAPAPTADAPPASETEADSDADETPPK